MGSNIESAMIEKEKREIEKMKAKQQKDAKACNALEPAYAKTEKDSQGLAWNS